MLSRSTTRKGEEGKLMNYRRIAGKGSLALRLGGIALCLALVAGLVGCGSDEEPAQGREGTEESAIAPMEERPPEPVQVPAEQGEPLMPARPGTQVIAKINDDPVTQEDLDLEVEAIIRRNFGGNVTPELQQQLRPRVEESAFRQLVLKSQLEAYSKEQELGLEEAEIDKQVDEVLSRYGTEEQIKTTLMQAGLTREEIRDDVARGTLMRNAIEHYVSKLPQSTTAEMETYYQEHMEEYAEPERVAASHILLRVTPELDAASKQAMREQAEKIREELIAGADFAELAQKHSDCESKTNGGNLGTFARGQVPPQMKEFEEAAFALEPGKISEVVETQFGFHIIRVSVHSQERVKEFDEVGEQLPEQIERDAVQAWFEELVRTAKVEKL
jgi:peptidyl-prolyl cis-trans isomerase C